MSKINKYIFLEISKGAFLIFFIFISISWLLQFTRLISLTNLIQVDFFTILYLSFFLIPNLITIIIPFVIIFGLITTFVKLEKDRELISLFSLGLGIKTISKPLIYFSIIILILLLSLNFYISPKIYKNYKIKEHDIRNKIDFDKIIISNFIEINKDTYIDFKRENKKFKEVFIKFKENNDNMIYAKEAHISQIQKKIKFILVDGFKITLLESGKIEKLEFENYTFEIINDSYKKYNNYDNNTFDIFEDIKNKNYLNIVYKIIDSFMIIFIIVFFFLNNIKNYKFNINSLLIFITFSVFILIFNQIFKNSELTIGTYSLFIFILISLYISYVLISKKNV